MDAALKIDTARNCKDWLALLPLTNAQQAHSALLAQMESLKRQVRRLHSYAEQGGINPSGEFRTKLDLFANIRPAISRMGVGLTGKPIDLVIFRECTEGFYADRNMFMGRGEFMPTEDIAIALADKHPDVDPLTVRFTDLHKWVMEIPNFQGKTEESNEGHLEMIQSKWVYEWRDGQK